MNTNERESDPHVESAVRTVKLTEPQRRRLVEIVRYPITDTGYGSAQVTTASLVRRGLAEYVGHSAVRATAMGRDHAITTGMVRTPDPTA